MTTISKIDIIRSAVPFETDGPRQGMRPGLNTNPWLAKESLIIRMETSDGREGWGEAFGHFAAMAVEAVLVELIAPWFIGRESSDIAGVMDEAHKSFFGFGRHGPIMYALSGLDTALWDLAGKRAGKPLYQLLGGPEGDVTLPRYASLMRYGGDTDAVARNTARAADLGFPMVKLHERDMASFQAARGAAPEGVAITLDVNCPWTVAEATEIAKNLKAEEGDRGGYLWLEEPVWPPEDFDGLAMVRKAGTAISGGENVASLVEFKRAIAAGAFDIVQPSVAKMGGVSCMKDVFPLCREANLRCMPHSFYWGPGYVASAHLLAAQVGQGADAPDWVETGFITFEENPHDLMDPMNPELVLKANRPGLGFEPNPVLFDKYLVRRTAVT